MNKYVLKDFFVIPLHSVFFHGTICSSTEYLWSIGKQTFTTWVRYFSFKNHVNCSWKKQCSKIVAGIRLLKDVLKWYIILQTRHLFLSTIRKYYQGNAKFTKEISNLHCYLCNVHLTTYVLSEKCSGFKIGEIVLYEWYINIIYTWTLGRFGAFGWFWLQPKWWGYIFWFFDIFFSMAISPHNHKLKSESCRLIP